MGELVLLRHGQSEWNRLNLFTGWFDCDLTDSGRTEAAAAGATMATSGFTPAIVHTSLQKRAIRTAQLALDEMNLMWLPVRRHWRLNERHYGDLTGRNKAETTERYGAEMVKVWRRSYDTAPPPIAADNPSNPNGDAQYADVPLDLIPAAECLADVVARFMPYWFDVLVPDLRTHGSVLVVAHGNSLRALVKHLDGISDDDITELNIPTGMPLRYEIDHHGRPTDSRPTAERYLGDPAAVQAAAAAVAAQAGASTGPDAGPST